MHAPTTHTQSLESRREWVLQQSEETSQIALEDFKCDQIEVFKMHIPIPAAPEMVQVIKRNSLGGRVLCPVLKLQQGFRLQKADGACNAQ